jgi:hypothetical protein
MKFLQAIFCITLVVCLFGCVPFPHNEEVTPRIDGTVVDDNNLRVTNLRIALADNTSCMDLVEETRTDESGKFILGPVEEFTLFIQLELSYGWRICAFPEGQVILLDDFSDIGVSSGERLTCTLSTMLEPGHMCVKEL